MTFKRELAALVCILSASWTIKTWRLPSNPWLRKVLNERANTVSLNDLVDWTHDLYVWEFFFFNQAAGTAFATRPDSCKSSQNWLWASKRAISKLAKEPVKDKHDWAVCVLRSGWSAPPILAEAVGSLLASFQYPKRFSKTAKTSAKTASKDYLASIFTMRSGSLFIQGQITLSDFLVKLQTFQIQTIDFPLLVFAIRASPSSTSRSK